MDTNALKKFAQSARNLLISQVTAKMSVVMDASSAARREHPSAMKGLEAAIAQNHKGEIIEQVAYTWFNRFTAFRFMDVNGYTNPRVVSPEGVATRPEILAEAIAGNLPDGVPTTIAAILEGRTPSRDPQAEAYRLLLVYACNAWHGPMPFLFEKVDDYTELLMPEDLLSPTSIIALLRDAMPEDDCKDVEIIGWLYQFYISEKKDQVFAGLKKNKKIAAEDIPAATQLFTPHWIVRYLVENSLGRLWLLNRPTSKLAERMDYYIGQDAPETDFLKIGKPEEIKVCDPACGSGHMLTYAFDLLHAIYEEEGYEADKIPGLILANNLTGVEIDDRAGALAAFALAMKSAAKLGRRRFLRMEEKPEIVVLQNVSFTPAEMTEVATVVGRDLFTDELSKTLLQFEQAKNLGSLIVPELRDPAETLRVVEERDFGGDLLLKEVQGRVMAVLRMAEALSSKYHLVVANPPYMGGKGMNANLSDFAKNNYKDSKSDLFAMFMERALRLNTHAGMTAMINMQSWMFISSFAKLRSKLLSDNTILSMAHLGERAFDSIGGAVVSTTAFVMCKKSSPEQCGVFLRLVDGKSEDEKSKMFLDAISDENNDIRFKANSKDFEIIAGSPIQYSLSNALVELFRTGNRVSDFARTASGLQTNDNGRFIKFWFEPELGEVEFGSRSRDAALKSKKRWFPHVKGGAYRKWYGNLDYVVNWHNDGEEIFELARKLYGSPTRTVKNLDLYFSTGVTWTDISSGEFGVRSIPPGFIFDTSAPSAFSDQEEMLLGILNSAPAIKLAKLLCPSLHFLTADIAKFPVPLTVLKRDENQMITNTKAMIELARNDWDAYETSWDFIRHPLLSSDYRNNTLEGAYDCLHAHWRGITEEMLRLEEENNRLFIDAYGLADELTPEVPIEEITLTCNPAYRYGVKGTDKDRESRMRVDIIAEFLSYAVGCMFGRYSIDEPGLVLANQGETLEDYLSRIPNPSFLPDKDNVIPVLDADWFEDDIVAQFRIFLRITFGDQHLRENLAFIEAQIGDIRKYFARGFFDDHVKRYKKRPIYWMFSSPRGTFQALIYMHRYRADTVSVLRNEYLVEFIRKLEAERGRLEKLADNPSASQSQRTRALKEMATIINQIAELEEWEREIIFPLAHAKIEIDLNDGVKGNYPLFGAALKSIKGLEATDE